MKVALAGFRGDLLHLAAAAEATSANYHMSEMRKWFFAVGDVDQNPPLCKNSFVPGNSSR